MTPQMKLVLTGGAVAAVSKFYFKKPLLAAAIYGLAAIAAVSILTAKPAQ